MLGTPSNRVFVVRPRQGWEVVRLGELKHYRDLLYFLVWRDLKVRYKQTVLGALWAIIPPLFTMIIFSIFFGRLAGIPSDGLPYPLFAFAALVPWTFFATALAQSSASVVANRSVITKVYFPRILLPVSSVLSALADFAIAFALLVCVVMLAGITPTVAILTIPLFVLLAVATALGVGLILSALNVAYRDVQYTVPFLIQFWLFASPIAYPSSLVQGPWRTLYGLNPMAGVVEGFRWALLGSPEAPGPMLWVSVAMVVLLLVAGLLYFRRVERTFADVV
jgi:lipopolysaccharide transport system permease protein